MVASKRSGIEAMLPTLFPGCQVRPWKPTGPKLAGHPRAVLAFLKDWASDAKDGAQIKFSEVYGSLGINADVFRKQVRGNKDLQILLANLDIREGGTDNRKNRYVLGKIRVSDV